MIPLVVVLQSLSRVWLCNPMDCSTPGFLVLHYLLELTQVHVPLSQWCYPTISSSAGFLLLPSVFPSIRSFLISWLFASVAKILAPQLQHLSPSNECSGFIPFRIDWFDLLAVQGTPESSSLKCTLISMDILNSTLKMRKHRVKSLWHWIWQWFLKSGLPWWLRQ